MTHRASDRAFTRSIGTAATLIVALGLAIASASPAAAMRNLGASADGDACTVRPGVPGTEKGIECCSTADPKDCTIPLKPFPGLTRMSRHG